MEKSFEYHYLQQLERGSREAFDALYLYYYPKVRMFLLSLTKEDEIAKDLAQDIFVKIWINRSTISSVSDFSSYLFSSCKNTLYNYYQHNLVKEKYVSSLQGMPNYAEFMEDDVFATELNGLIQSTIANMPSKRRAIFVMSRTEGMTNGEIAEKLKISKRTVENQITLALSMLRKVVMAAKMMV